MTSTDSHAECYKRTLKDLRLIFEWLSLSYYNAVFSDPHINYPLCPTYHLSR